MAIAWRLATSSSSSASKGRGTAARGRPRSLRSFLRRSLRPVSGAAASACRLKKWRPRPRNPCSRSSSRKAGSVRSLERPSPSTEMDSLRQTPTSSASFGNAVRCLASPGGARALAVQSDSYEALQIVSAATHPAWRQGSIGAMSASCAWPLDTDWSRCAWPAQQGIAALRRGAPLAAFGFPAASTDPARPRGRLSVDIVGDVRGDYLEVGLDIAPGTSGSPVFDSSRRSGGNRRGRRLRRRADRYEAERVGGELGAQRRRHRRTAGRQPLTRR